MGTPFYQSLDPNSVPDPVTPSDSPGDPSGYSMVTPAGQGTAPYNIQADNGQAAIEAAAQAAGEVAGAGIVYPQGTRQRATETLLDSVQGFSAGTGTSGYDIPQGWSGEPDGSWPNNVQVSSIFDTPIQGSGTYPGTTQDGVPQYGTS